MRIAAGGLLQRHEQIQPGSQAGKPDFGFFRQAGPSELMLARENSRRVEFATVRQIPNAVRQAMA
jgi:hypothetical protein